MEWGTFQSVLQLSVGLNTVVFSFTELRQPVISREKRLLQAIQLPLEDKLLNPDLADSAQELKSDFIQLKVNFDTIVLRSEKFDGVIRILCLIMAVIYWVLLVFSSFRPTMKITYPIATVVSLAGYVPIVFCACMNVRAGHQVRRKVRKGRTKLERKLVALGPTVGKIENVLPCQGVSSEAQRMINDTTGTLVKQLENHTPGHLHDRLRDMIQTLANANSVAQLNKSDWGLRQEVGNQVWSLDLGDHFRLYFRWDSNIGYADRIYVSS
jgi:hypothetical protein